MAECTRLIFGVLGSNQGKFYFPTTNSFLFCTAGIHLILNDYFLLVFIHLSSDLANQLQSHWLLPSSSFAFSTPMPNCCLSPAIWSLFHIEHFSKFWFFIAKKGIAYSVLNFGSLNQVFLFVSTPWLSFLLDTSFWLVLKLLCIDSQTGRVLKGGIVLMKSIFYKEEVKQVTP